MPALLCGQLCTSRLALTCCSCPGCHVLWVGACVCCTAPLSVDCLLLGSTAAFAGLGQLLLHKLRVLLAPAAVVVWCCCASASASTRTVFFRTEMPSAACLPVFVLLITIVGICGCQAVICRAANPTYVYTSCPDAAAAALCADDVLHRCVCTVCV